MDSSLILEVLLDTGYVYILGGCTAALILLLILRKVLPEKKSIEVNFSVSKEKVFMSEEFEIDVEVSALRKVKIEELSFFVECLTISPLKGHNKKSHFFHKQVVLSNVALYPKCNIEESRQLSVPEKNKEYYLPGTFNSQKGDFAIVWEAGYSIQLGDRYEKVEGTRPLTVYPVSAGW